MIDTIHSLVTSNFYTFFGGFGACFLAGAFVYNMGKFYADWKKTKIESFGEFKADINNTVNAVWKRLQALEDKEQKEVRYHEQFKQDLIWEIGKYREFMADAREALEKLEIKTPKVVKSPPAAGKVNKKPGRR